MCQGTAERHEIGNPPFLSVVFQFCKQLSLPSLIRIDVELPADNILLQRIENRMVFRSFKSVAVLGPGIGQDVITNDTSQAMPNKNDAVIVSVMQLFQKLHSLSPDFLT